MYLIVSEPSGILVRMVEKKLRVPVPPELRDEVLFRSDRTCCICREKRKEIQTHHVNDDPSDNRFENLAVLCLDCHAQTQMTGGFGRRLNACLVIKYRDDWLKIVEVRRAANSLKYRGIVQGSGSMRVSTADDSAKETRARQVSFLADEFKKTNIRADAMRPTTQILADILIEFAGASDRCTLQLKLAKSRHDAPGLLDDYGNELASIVTRYSAHAYRLRSQENELYRGIRTQLKVIRILTPDQRPDSVARNMQGIKRLLEARLRSVDSLQGWSDSTLRLKGKSSKLDEILQHMQDAVSLSISQRDSYESLHREVCALDV